MENTKLIQLLKTFNRLEINDFGKLVRSPFFNESPKLILLYEMLKENYPDFEPSSFDKRSIFKKLYPQEKIYNDKKIRSILNLMLDLAEEYLLQKEIKKDEIGTERYLLSQYFSRKLESHFKKILKKMDETIEKSRLINNKYFQNRYYRIQAKRSFFGFTKPIGKRHEQFDDFARETGMLEKYSILKLLKYYLIMRNAGGHLSFDFDYSLLHILMKYIDEKKFIEYPIFEIFKNLHKLETFQFDEKLYSKTKNLFFDSIATIEKEDSILISIELYNIATKYSNQGIEKYRYEQFDILKKINKYGIYAIENEYMSESHYLNTVYMALSIGEMGWTENFINEYKDKLNPSVSNNAFIFSLGLIDMIRKNYGKALEEFAKVKVDDFYYYLRIKYNRLKIYYDIEEYETIFSEIDAFKHYLHKYKEIPAFIQKRATNFLSLLNRTVKAKIDNNLDELMELKQILENPDIEQRDWLKNKIGILLKDI